MAESRWTGQPAQGAAGKIDYLSEIKSPLMFFLNGTQEQNAGIPEYRAVSALKNLIVFAVNNMVYSIK